MVHKGTVIALALAGGLAAQASPQSGKAVSKKPVNPVNVELRRTPLQGLGSGLRVQVEALRDEHQSAKYGLATMKSLVEHGLATASQLKEAEDRCRTSEAALHEAETKLEREVRLALLERPLDLRLTDASLRQAAIALTEAAGVPVVVDENVPSEKRLTLDAKGVTLGLVLETLAQKADLMIAPDPRGIRIRTWPTLEVNGQRMVKRSSLAPWSEEWTGYLFLGDKAAFGSPFGSGGGVLFSRGGPEGFATQVPVPPVPPLAVQPSAPVPGAPPAVAQPRLEFQAPAMAWRAFIGQGAGSVALSPVGDRNVVVAEPGVGENGEAGYWLTVYRLDNERLRKLSSTFHPAARQSAQFPSGLVPVYPGFVRPGTRPPTTRPPTPRRSVPPPAPTPGAVPAPRQPEAPPAAPDPQPK